MRKSELIEVLDRVEGDPEIRVAGADVAVVVESVDGSYVTLDEGVDPFLADDRTMFYEGCKCLWLDPQNCYPRFPREFDEDALARIPGPRRSVEELIN